MVAARQDRGRAGDAIANLVAEIFGPRPFPGRHTAQRWAGDQVHRRDQVGGGGGVDQDLHQPLEFHPVRPHGAVEDVAAVMHGRQRFCATGSHRTQAGPQHGHLLGDGLVRGCPTVDGADDFAAVSETVVLQENGQFVESLLPGAGFLRAVRGPQTDLPQDAVPDRGNLRLALPARSLLVAAVLLAAAIWRGIVSRRRPWCRRPLLRSSPRRATTASISAAG